MLHVQQHGFSENSQRYCVYLEKSTITYSKTASTFSLKWQGVIIGTALLVSKAKYTVVFAVAMAATM